MKFYKYVLVMVLFLSFCRPSPLQEPQAQVAETSTPVGGDVSSVYEIPEWLRDPQTNILIYTQWMSNPKHFDSVLHPLVFLLDPGTGSRFSLRLENGQPYEWIDNQHVGFSPLQNLACPSGMAYSYILHLASGDLLVNDSRKLFCVPEQPQQILVNTWDGNVEYSSADGDVEFMPSSADFENVHARLSPDATTMVIIRRDLTSENPNRLGIYEFPTGREIAVLYVHDLNPGFHFIKDQHKIAYFEGNTPCILDWDVLAKECRSPLPDTYHHIYFEYINDDATVIGFMYPGIHTSDGGGWVLCVDDIGAGEISCPTKDLAVFAPMKSEIEGRDFVTADSVIDTLFSPDGKFVYFVYGDGVPGGHFFPSAINKAVMNIEEGGFLDLGLAREDGFYSSSASTGQWRPLP